MKKQKSEAMEVKAVRVPAALWRDTKRAARINRTSVSEFIRSALEEKVGRILMEAHELMREDGK